MVMQAGFFSVLWGYEFDISGWGFIVLVGKNAHEFNEIIIIGVITPSEFALRLETT